MHRLLIGAGDTQTISGNDGNVFVMNGSGAELSLEGNSCGMVFMQGANQAGSYASNHLALDTSDGNETVFDQTPNALISIADGVTGLVKVFGFSDPTDRVLFSGGNAEIATPVKLTIGTDGHGGTLLSTPTGAIDFVGAHLQYGGQAPPASAYFIELAGA
jgi:hypothetical protein